jgi:transglutaminase-like putative cysteine protease
MIVLELFGLVAPGWSRVQAVCDWVQSKVNFGYQYARPTKSAWDVFTERFGVCRDFQLLAVTMCRALNIPARYATGYLGDFGVPASPDPHGLQRMV